MSMSSKALDQAQDLVFDAWEEDDPRVRLRLARKALEISADCADAYVLLAMEGAGGDAEAVALYAEGVAAGARALGDARFRDDAGDFWGLTATRPYMRARFGLARALWVIGRRDEAVQHAAEMLRLNPNDNQGIRYLLVSWLVTVGRDEAARDLLGDYPQDSSASWAWSRVLLAFRQGGSGLPMEEAFNAARASNSFVPSSLLQRRKGPPDPPEYYSPGDHGEAEMYAVDGLAAWSATPGALEWLRRHVKSSAAH